jgi:hypothetical protein
MNIRRRARSDWPGMTPPSGAPTLLSLTATVFLLAPVDAWADATHDQLRRAVQRDLPSYDPAIREKYVAGQAAKPPPQPKNTPAPLPEEKSAGVPARSAPLGEPALELPKITVRAIHERPRMLPRFEPPPAPVGGDLKAEPFESAAGREARLIKKHVSKLSQALNRFSSLFGVSPLAMAEEAEAREQKANLMNGLAEGIEMQELLGRDPAEIKKLRAEYQKLYYSGPK